MEFETAERTDELCPACSTADPLEIAYGLATFEFYEQAPALGYALGGCEITDESPKWRCPACGFEWGLVPY
jgi:hypothetical protein